MPNRSARTEIVTLTMNPAVDLSFSVDQLAPGRKLRCHYLRRDPGGGGVNVARVVKRLGGRARAIFPAGGANGDRLLAMLKAERVAALAIPIRGETREDITVEDLSGAEELRFVAPGPRLRPREIAATVQALETQVRRPAILVASGSLPPGAALGLYARVARIARRKGVRFVLDAGGAPLRRALAEGVWLVKPNLLELEEVTRKPLQDLESRLAACRALISNGGAELAALSLGAEGALLVSGHEAWSAAAPRIAPISTVGAGDSFLAGLISALAAGASHPEALTLGVAAGAAALLAPGTQLCRRGDVQSLAAKVAIERIDTPAVTATRPRRAAA
jgi:6-phosphofructokinase 2